VIFHRVEWKHTSVSCSKKKKVPQMGCYGNLSPLLLMQAFVSLERSCSGFSRWNIFMSGWFFDRFYDRAFYSRERLNSEETSKSVDSHEQLSRSGLFDLYKHYWGHHIFSDVSYAKEWNVFSGGSINPRSRESSAEESCYMHLLPFKAWKALSMRSVNDLGVEYIRKNMGAPIQ